jgi:hypothetical protein
MRYLSLVPQFVKSAVSSLLSAESTSERDPRGTLIALDSQGLTARRDAMQESYDTMYAVALCVHSQSRLVD